MRVSKAVVSIGFKWTFMVCVFFGGHVSCVFQVGDAESPIDRSLLL